MASKRVTVRLLRMVLDFEVEVEGLTDESLREYYRRFPDFEGTVGNRELWANISRQIRLQRALLGDVESLRRYLTHVVVTEVDASLDSKLAAAFGVGGLRAEEEILEPLFPRLGEEDEQFYCEVSEDDLLADNTGPLEGSFRCRWVAARLEEVRVVGEGKLGEAESDNLM